MTDIYFPAADLPSWLHWLEQLDPARIELGLDRVSRVYRNLPQLKRAQTKVVSVAGTNGKGTAVATIEALALRQGLRVVSYYSPHIQSFNERIRVQGIDIGDVPLIAAFESVYRAKADADLTYFEYTTLAALVIAARECPDLLVLEVGLGGRLDAVNIVDSDIAVVTSIDLDHQAWLGNTRDEIALEKVAIARPGKRLVCGEPDIPAVFLPQASTMQARPLCIGVDFHMQLQEGGSKGRFRFGNTAISLKLAGFHANSLACGLTAFECLYPGSLSLLETDALLPKLTGRFEQFFWRQQALILDVAHNPAAWQALGDRLVALDIMPTCVFGVMADKDFDAALRVLGPRTGKWHFCQLPTARAMSVENMQSKAADILGPDRIGCALVVETNWQNLLDTSAVFPLLVTGSFYTVAAFKEFQKRSDGLAETAIA